MNKFSEIALELDAQSQEEAELRGLTHYQGKPCKYGHTTRYTSDKSCVTCKTTSQFRFRQKSAGKGHIYVRPSRMVQIDHLIEQRAEQALLDPYYDMEF